MADNNHPQEQNQNLDQNAEKPDVKKLHEDNMPKPTGGMNAGTHVKIQQFMRGIVEEDQNPDDKPSSGNHLKHDKP